MWNKGWYATSQKYGFALELWNLSPPIISHKFSAMIFWVDFDNICLHLFENFSEADNSFHTKHFSVWITLIELLFEFLQIEYFFFCFDVLCYLLLLSRFFTKASCRYLEGLIFLEVWILLWFDYFFVLQYFSLYILNFDLFCK